MTPFAPAPSPGFGSLMEIQQAVEQTLVALFLFRGKT
jgi:hypothetical protein